MKPAPFPSAQDQIVRHFAPGDTNDVRILLDWLCAVCGRKADLSFDRGHSRHPFRVDGHPCTKAQLIKIVDAERIHRGMEPLSICDRRTHQK